LAHGARERGSGGARDARAGVELLYGLHPVFEALRARRRRLLRLRVREGRGRPELAPLLAAAREAGIPIEEASGSDFAARLGEGANHQGVSLEAGPATPRGPSSRSTRSRTRRISARSHALPRRPARAACC
jgi:tRNA G18 (ribose-2'-O)-methylase SpoU